MIYTSAAADETALSELYDVTARRVYGLAMRVLGSPVHAKAVDRAIYREVWRTSTSFDVDRGSARDWIMAIAHRRAVDRLRLVRDVTPSPRRGSGRGVGRGVRHENEPDSAHMADVLAGLTPEQRETLELAYFDGYSPTIPADLTESVSEIVHVRMRPQHIE